MYFRKLSYNSLNQIIKHKAIFTVALCCALFSCSTNKKLHKIQKENLSAEISLSEIHNIQEFEIRSEKDTTQAVAVTDLTGNKFFLMKAVTDSSGTLHATQQLDAAIITARFRNIPERNGKVKLGFDLHIPEGLIDSKWQIRFEPSLYFLQDTMQLEKVFITGTEYFEKQLRGYELYEKFINSIVTDSAKLMYVSLLEIFIERNIPQLASLKSDTSYIDPHIRGVYDITFSQAKEYYTKKFANYINNRRINAKEKKFNKYIKDPIIQDGIRIDSVIRNPGNGITYHYTQWLQTRKDLKKIDLVVKGEIFEYGEKIHTIPTTSPLTYYISSFSSMCEDIEKYLTEIIERRVHINTTAAIDFKINSHSVDTSIGNNAQELSKIEELFKELIDNQEFNIDSILITASCSPDGPLKLNRQLSAERSLHIEKHLIDFSKEYIEQLQQTENPITILNKNTSADHEEYSMEETNIEPYADIADEIHRYSVPEDWETFFELISRDETIDRKDEILKLCQIDNQDSREKRLSAHSQYLYIKENIYPKLRRVKFDFHLHRKGMTKDTIHTTVLDTLYQSGVKALKDRDYHKAVTILGRYRDINSALAFISLDYNASAMNILQDLPKSSKRDYLMAILYSRMGNKPLATELYLQAIEQDPHLRFRGNLDPEISSLIENNNLERYEEHY